MSDSDASSVASVSDSEPEVELIDNVVPVADAEGHVQAHLMTDAELLAVLPASDLELPQDMAAAEDDEGERKAQSIVAFPLRGRGFKY